MSLSKPSVRRHCNGTALPSFSGCFTPKAAVFNSAQEMAVSDGRCSSLFAHLSSKADTVCPSSCQYCVTLASLDMAAFYWSYMAACGGQAADGGAPSSPMSSSSRSFCPSPGVSDGCRSPVESLCSNGESQPPSPSTSVSSGEFKDAACSSPKYQCRVCQKTYSHPRLLNRHVQSHTPYKKHHCPQCGKGFNDAFDLKRHIRTHTGVKPFKCSMCEKSFTQRCSLEAHATRVHGLSHEFAFRERRPKVYVCEECGSTFNDNSKFRKHVKEHHGSYPPRDTATR